MLDPVSNAQGLQGGGGAERYRRFNLTTTLVPYPYLAPNTIVPVWVQENCSCREKCDVWGCSTGFFVMIFA